MASYKRSAHLLPSGIAGLGATLAIAVAMVGTAAAAAAPDYRGAQDFRASQSDVGLSALRAPAEDFGTQDFGTAGSAAGLSAAAPSGLEITSALQPGQTLTSMASGNYSGSVGDEVPWAPVSGLTSALQPGQTDSLVTPGNAPASRPTSAIQPGQTDSLAASGNGSGSIGGATSLTSVLGTTSAPQPGQTGW